MLNILNILKDILNRLLHIDYIVDEGTSGNWKYIKYASGWAEAWYRGNIGQVTLSTQLGTDIVSNSIFIDFPFSFVEIPYCILNYEGNSSGYTNVQHSNAGTTTVSKSYGIRLSRIGTSSITLQGNTVSCYVKGRWKSVGGVLLSLLTIKDKELGVVICITC